MFVSLPRGASSDTPCASSKSDHLCGHNWSAVGSVNVTNYAWTDAEAISACLYMTSQGLCRSSPCLHRS